jgi:hypothetical protein
MAEQDTRAGMAGWGDEKQEPHAAGCTGKHFVSFGSYALSLQYQVGVHLDKTESCTKAGS